MELPKTYEPSKIEPKWQNFWEKENLYIAGKAKSKKTFVIMMPPPNVTGMLHMGHVLNNTLQDVYARIHRMKGYDVLWLPGIDHAGIATQNVVEKELAKEGKTRFDLGREKFVERVFKWKEKYEKIIISQLKRLGCSCDWTRYRFTMDKELSEAVTTAFVKLYEKGLIYKGNYIINFCPRCETTLSDEEVEREEIDGKLYYIKYPLEENGTITVATTRPETMLGDTAVAVNPGDERYKNLIGKYAILPFIGRKLKIIADKRVDPEFGTGAVKVTPAHDPLDFEIAKEHNLEFVTIMDTKGIINEKGGEFKGMDRFKARRVIIEKLKEMGLLEKIEDYKINLGKCYRCDTVIEPYLSEQWFVNMKEMARKAYEAAEKGKVKFYPPSWKKLYDNWLLNIRDWVISRQLWWGHRIPVYICENCGFEKAYLERPEKCEKCQKREIKQDEDVLDTWFSSWLWPFSTLGWPKKTEDLKRYYPGNLLVSAWEILFFWIARMIMAGLEFMGEIPFRDVLIHGVLRDERRRKLSKSLGNSPDPMDLFDKYGVDGVRISLLLITPEGKDIIFTEEKMKLGRNFCNKLWNAARFILINIREGEKFNKDIEGELYLEDKWIISEWNYFIENFEKNLKTYNYPEFMKNIYNFFWSKFCDYYIESIKDRLKDEKERRKALTISLKMFKNILKVIHPVAPHITEELWSLLPVEKEEESISLSEWPTKFEIEFKKEGKEMESLISIIETIREIKGIYNIPYKKEVKVYLSSEKEERFKVLLKNFAYAEVKKGKPEKNFIGYFIKGEEVLIEFPSEVNIEKEKERVKKEIKELKSILENYDKKLKNPNFLEKAPYEVVKKTEQKREEIYKKLKTLENYI